MPRRAQNNPRQLRAKSCGCKLCIEAYPPAEHGERKSRRDCVGSWQARFRDPAGKQKAKNFPKKKDADQFLDRIRTAVRDRSYHDPERGKITLEQWWAIWWNVNGKKGRTTTRNRKLSSWNAHINPKWGKYRLIDLEFMDIQDWLTNEVKGHATQVKVLQLLNMMLRDALRDGKRIPFNPAAEVVVTASAPVKHPDELKPPTREQYALVRRHLPEDYHPLVVFLEETGMRWGEATAVRRCHVDLDAGIVKVREVVIDDHGVLKRQAAPKTQAGFRIVPLTPEAIDAVKAMIERWEPASTESVVEDGMHPEELIFRSHNAGAVKKVNGVPTAAEGVLNRNNFRRYWIPAIKDAGLARKVKNPETGRWEWWPRVHDYRHALATRLHAMGVSEKDVQLVLGQKRGGKVTWLYTHSSDEALVTVLHAMQGKRRLHVVPEADAG